MYYPVAERGGFNNAFFGIGNDEFAVAAVFVDFVHQLPPQGKQIFFQFVAELQNGTAIAFANARPAVSGVEILNVNNLIKKKHIKNPLTPPKFCGAEVERGNGVVFSLSPVRWRAVSFYLTGYRRRNKSRSRLGTDVMSVDIPFGPRIITILIDEYRAQRNPTLLFVLPVSQFRFSVKAPAPVPVTQLPPRRKTLLCSALTPSLIISLKTYSASRKGAVRFR